MPPALPAAIDEETDLAPPTPSRAAWIGLAILTLINLLNYVDRFIVPALMESIRHSELHPSDAQLGTLSSAFILVYMVAAPFIGMLGDRRSRPRLLAAGVALWSIATALGGLAPTYHWLLAARASVGIGEAAYGTIAPALLADYFPRHLRGRVFSIFFAATPVGSALGYMLGGWVDVHFGWREAFYVAGLPGLLLAGLALGLYEPRRAERDAAARTRRRRQGLATYLDLLRIRPYRLTILGYAAYTFALGGLAVWMPAFLERVRGLPREHATVTFGAVVVVTGFVGTFLGGWIGDSLLRRTRQAYLWLSGATTLAAAPLAWIALTAISPHAYWLALVAAEVLIFMSTGPINSQIVNAVPAIHRAAAMALTIFTIHILGDVPSPWLIGKLSDLSSLEQAVRIIPAAVAVGGAIWLWGAWRRDAAPPPE